MIESPKTRGSHGGRRAGAGRPQQRIHLDQETANILRELTRLWHAETPEGAYTPVRVVEEMIWREALRRGALEPAQRDRWQAVARGE